VETVFVALRVLLSLAAVVGLLWLLQRRLTRGSKTQRGAKLLTVVTRQSLSPKASVVMLDADGTRFLLGVTEHSVTVLSSAETPAAPVSITAPTTARAKSAAVSNAAALSSAAVSSAAAFDEVMLKQGGSLDGSILALSTWKRAAAALRQRR
jgi:flagellar protein FliO/FliZ